MPPVYKQGKLGSCTAQVFAAVIEYDAIRKNLKPTLPSRLFMYFNERRLRGRVKEDLGSHLVDGVNALARWGYCPEELWPYDVKKFATQPPALCYERATPVSLSNRVLPRSLPRLKEALVEGTPVACGIVMYHGFYRAPKTGRVPLPTKEQTSRGAHAVLLVGYDEEEQVFIVRNSWGDGWGDKGYGYMPYAYLMNPLLAHDFQALSLASSSSSRPASAPSTSDTSKR